MRGARQRRWGIRIFLGACLVMILIATLRHDFAVELLIHDLRSAIRARDTDAVLSLLRQMDEHEGHCVVRYPSRRIPVILDDEARSDWEARHFIIGVLRRYYSGKIRECGRVQFYAYIWLETEIDAEVVGLLIARADYLASRCDDSESLAEFRYVLDDIRLSGDRSTDALSELGRRSEHWSVEYKAALRAISTR